MIFLYYTHPFVLKYIANSKNGFVSMKMSRKVETPRLDW